MKSQPVTDQQLETEARVKNLSSRTVRNCLFAPVVCIISKAPAALSDWKNQKLHQTGQEQTFHPFVWE